MWTLLSCDYWRDGGSYSATLRSSERLVSLWLQVKSWDRVEDRQYEALYVTNGRDPTLKAQRVAPGSGESEWLALLENDVDRAAADLDIQERFTEMVSELRTLRERCR